MGYWCFDAATHEKLGPASEEDCEQYTETLQKGKRSFPKGYFGYNKQVYVKKVEDSSN